MGWRLSPILVMCAFVLGSAPAAASDDRAIVVFAAASLKGALDDVAGAFKATSGQSATVSYAGTSTLARQIELGAPADVFVSANADWVDQLENDGLLRPGSRRTIMGNRLVLVAPLGSIDPIALDQKTDLRTLLGDDGRLAIANTTAVPAGLYGKAALTELGLWDQIADVRVETDDVRAALAFVARGEAPLGVVYATDAAAEPAVEVAAVFPADSHPPIRYHAAIPLQSMHDSSGSISRRPDLPTRSGDLLRLRFRASRPGPIAMFAALSPEEWQAIRLSLQIASIAALCSLPFGLCVAYVLARFRFPGRALINALVYLPLVMPPVVTGYLLLLVFGRRGPVGRFLDETFGVVLAFNWTGAALAAGIMGFPLMVRAMQLSLEAIDRRYEAAAATLGAGRVRVLLSITLPLMLPGILAGTVLAFARALGEFGATITFVGNIPGVTQTIPSAIYSAIQVPGGETAALRLTAISVVIAFAALLISEFLARRAARRVLGE